MPRLIFEMKELGGGLYFSQIKEKYDAQMRQPFYHVYVYTLTKINGLGSLLGFLYKHHPRSNRSVWHLDDMLKQRLPKCHSVSNLEKQKYILARAYKGIHIEATTP